MKIFSMDNRKVIYKLGIVLALAFSVQGCKPAYDEIDNNNVVSKPYVLYIGDTLGTIYKTNDGLNFEVVLSSDNYRASAIATSGKNLLFIKRNVHVVEDFGKGNNSNPTYISTGLLTPYGESIIINVPKFGNRIYLGGGGTRGYLYNDSNGKPGINYTNWRSEIQLSIPSNNVFTSFTILDNGILIAYDDINKRTFKLTARDAQWEQTTGTKLPNSGKFIITHSGNTLVAADLTGTNGVYYSNNEGNSWQQYSGLPASTKILSVNGGFGQTVLIGTDGKGVYRLPLGRTAFVSANLGLPQNARVGSLSEKYDLYKNDKRVEYIYAATDKGVYRSQDLGENWVKVFDGVDGKGSYNLLY